VVQRIGIQVIGPETAPNPPEALAQVAPPAPVAVLGQEAAPLQGGATDVPGGEGTPAAEQPGRG
jgi:hypothetical protein